MQRKCVTLPQGQSLWQTIYQYLVAQIKLGYYKKGDRLLTIHELCKRFRVSIGTAHKALLQLRDDRYIALAKGTPAVVIWDFSEVTKQSCDPQYFSLRRDTLLELDQTVHLLFPPLWLVGLHLLPEEAQEERQRLEARGDLFAYFHFLLRPLGNPLLLRLFYDIDDFMNFVYLRKVSGDASMKTSLQLSAALVAYFPLWEKQDFAALYRQFDAISQESQDSLRTWLDHSIPAAATEQISFQWQACRGRVQDSCVLAADLIRGILTGSYAPGQFLPSATALSQAYDTSVMEVRHTIGVLNRLGITKTRNGRGSYVLPWKESIVTTALRSPDLRKKMLLYLQCLQILSLTIAALARSVLPKAQDSACATVEAALSADLRSGVLLSTPNACLRLIIGATENTVMRKIYVQCLDTLRWGYLYYFQPSHLETIKNWSAVATDLLEALQQREPDAFAFTLQECFAGAFHLSKQALLSIGIDEAGELFDPYALFHRSGRS